MPVPRFSPVLSTAFLAGTLDIAAAFINYLLHGGRQLANVLVYIASGLLGETAYHHSRIGVAAIGLAAHYLIALCWTVMFFYLMKNRRWFSWNKYLRGSVFGVLVWMVMNLFVIPLSGTPPSSSGFADSLLSMGILMIAFGIPISLMMQRYCRAD